MRIASWIPIVMLWFGLWSCSAADVITPTQVVLDQALETFPFEWLGDYQDGQTYVFANGQGQEQAWTVFRGPLAYQICEESLAGDTIYICEQQYLELSNPSFVGRVQLFGRDSTLFLDPDGQQVLPFDPANSAFARVDGSRSYFVQYGEGSPITPSYEWNYRYGPTYPAIGSDSLYLFKRREAIGSQFVQLLFVQGRGWAAYQDTTGVQWVLERVEG